MKLVMLIFILYIFYNILFINDDNNKSVTQKSSAEVDDNLPARIGVTCAVHVVPSEVAKFHDQVYRFFVALKIPYF